MRTRQAKERTCSYVVLVNSASSSAEDLRELAKYLSGLDLAGCEVVMLDPSPRPRFDANARTLRWVGRHVQMRDDVVRAATAASACEKVIVAADDVRYSRESIARLCALLDTHEVVEPQDYLDPLPWWGGIDAGRILVHRGIEPKPDHGATFGFRRSVIRSLRTLTAADAGEDPPRRLAAHGAEVYPAADVFVRREPRLFVEWLAQRPRAAHDEFTLHAKTAFFLSLIPLLLLLGIAGDLRLAAGFASVISFTSVTLAVRGRIGASEFFPLRACLFAPLWILERSLSVYWALFRKLRGADVEAARVPVPDRARGERVASGE